MLLLGRRGSVSMQSLYDVFLVDGFRGGSFDRGTAGIRSTSAVAVVPDGSASSPPLCNLPTNQLVSRFPLRGCKCSQRPVDDCIDANAQAGHQHTRNVTEVSF